MEPKPYLDDVGLDRFKQNMLTKFRAALENKVDKIVGKVLSSNDYTDEEKSTVADLKTKMTTLLSDAQTPGSVEYITLNAMLAIIDGAPEDFNTLKEMSDWISTHEDSAATMNSNIQDNARAITALQTGKVDKETGKGLSSNDFSDADKSKLDSVEAGANNYSLPLATDTVRGGAKVGYTANGNNYPVQLSNGQMFVNVPWDNKNLESTAFDALNAIAQLDHQGFYSFATVDENFVNGDVVNDDDKFTNWNAGDFEGLLITDAYDENGCRYGTFIVTSPRFTAFFWVGRIWQGRFLHWQKIYSPKLATSSEAGLISAKDKTWVDGKFRRYIYGYDVYSDDTKNGYYKIASYQIANNNASTSLKLRISSNDDFFHWRQPIEFTIQHRFSANVCEVLVFTDFTDRSSDLWDKLYVKYENQNVDGGNISLYYNRDVYYGCLCVDVLGETQRGATSSDYKYQFFWDFDTTNMPISDPTEDGFEFVNIKTLLRPVATATPTEAGLMSAEDKQLLNDAYTYGPRLAFLAHHTNSTIEPEIHKLLTIEFNNVNVWSSMHAAMYVEVSSVNEHHDITAVRGILHLFIRHQADSGFQPTLSGAEWEYVNSTANLGRIIFTYNNDGSLLELYAVLTPSTEASGTLLFKKTSQSNQIKRFEFYRDNDPDTIPDDVVQVQSICGKLKGVAYDTATASKSGLMSAEDKTKLDGMTPEIYADLPAIYHKNQHLYGIYSNDASTLYYKILEFKLSGSMDCKTAFTTIFSPNEFNATQQNIDASFTATGSGILEINTTTPFPASKSDPAYRYCTWVQLYAKTQNDADENGNFTVSVYWKRLVPWHIVSVMVYGAYNKGGSLNTTGEIVYDLENVGVKTIEEEGFTVTCLADARVALGLSPVNKVVVHCLSNSVFMPIIGGTFTGDITAPTANFTNLNVTNPPWTEQISALEARIAALENKT